MAIFYSPKINFLAALDPVPAWMTSELSLPWDHIWAVSITSLTKMPATNAIILGVKWEDSLPTSLLSCMPSAAWRREALESLPAERREDGKHSLRITQHSHKPEAYRWKACTGIWSQCAKALMKHPVTAGSHVLFWKAECCLPPQHSPIAGAMLSTSWPQHTAE